MFFFSFLFFLPVPSPAPVPCLPQRVCSSRAALDCGCRCRRAKTPRLLLPPLLAVLLLLLLLLWAVSLGMVDSVRSGEVFVLSVAVVARFLFFVFCQRGEWSG